MIKFPYYLEGIKNSYADGYISIGKFVEKNANTNSKQSLLLDKIKLASEKGDKKLKTDLKEKLVFFTPSVIIKKGSSRKYDNIETFTGLAQLDFDGLETTSAIEFKEFLFETYSELYTVYLSPSKKGVKALINIPISKDVSEFQDYYRAIQEEFEIYDGFDPAPKNAVLPLYLSNDVFIRYRENPKLWNVKKEVKKDLRELYPIPFKPYKSLKSNDKNKNRAINTVRKAINSIVDSPGHYQLRSACLIFGTRVGAGYVDYYEAIAEVSDLVSNNRYLAKGTNGYIKTATWAIDSGKLTPKTYN